MFSTFLNGDDGGALKERERKGIKENKHFAAIITDDQELWSLVCLVRAQFTGKILKFISKIFTVSQS